MYKNKTVLTYCLSHVATIQSDNGVQKNHPSPLTNPCINDCCNIPRSPFLCFATSFLRADLMDNVKNHKSQSRDAPLNDWNELLNDWIWILFWHTLWPTEVSECFLKIFLQKAVATIFCWKKFLIWGFLRLYFLFKVDLQLHYLSLMVGRRGLIYLSAKLRPPSNAQIASEMEIAFWYGIIPKAF